MRSWCSAAGGEDTAGDDAGRAAEQIGRQRRGGDGEWNGEHGVEHRRRERLQPDHRERVDAEIGKAHDDRPLPEELQAPGQRMGHAAAAMAARQARALRREQGENHGADDAHGHQRGPPSEGGAEPVAHHGGNCPAEIAADAVGAVRGPQAARRDVGVENREIGRMKDAIADPHHADEEIEPAERRHQPGNARSAGEKRDAGEQDRARTNAIDGEAGGELGDSARDVEHRNQRAKRGERHAEFVAQQREERRQRELEEMRQRMGDPDQTDHLRVTAEREVGCGVQSVVVKRDGRRLDYTASGVRSRPSPATLPALPELAGDPR